MKPSKRNLFNAAVKRGELRNGPPKISKYGRKVRGQPTGPAPATANQQLEQAATETPPYTSARIWKDHYK